MCGPHRTAGDLVQPFDHAEIEPPAVPLVSGRGVVKAVEQDKFSTREGGSDQPFHHFMAGGLKQQKFGERKQRQGDIFHKFANGFARNGRTGIAENENIVIP